MFESDIRLYGKHAEILKRYSRDKQSEQQYRFTVKNNDGNPRDIYIFETMIQCYMVAAMLGIINKKTAEEDSSNKNVYSNIMTEQVIGNKTNLKRITQFMLLSSEKENVDKRIKQAFTVKKENDKEIEKMVMSYARGGLEIIGTLFAECFTYEDVGYKILELLEEYGVKQS